MNWGFAEEGWVKTDGSGLTAYSVTLSPDGDVDREAELLPTPRQESAVLKPENN